MTQIQSILDFANLKAKSQKFSVITCYDYTSALIAAASEIDVILVGDSVAMTMQGHKSTVFANVADIAMHTKWVMRGLESVKSKIFVIADIPFLAARSEFAKNIDAAREIMQSGAHAIKIEGADGNLELITHLVQSGVPVCGHLGLTPQSVNVFGGYKVQGKNDTQFQKILDDAKKLEAAGCFAIVLECVPTELARQITNAINIPTIGIGAGKMCDAQVLVWQDLLGLNTEFKPKFVRNFTNGADIFTNALNDFHNEVVNGTFPNESESFK